MFEGRYTNPTHKIQLDSKILCVVVTYVSETGYAMSGYVSHRDEPHRIPYEENVIEVIKFMLACYKKYASGVDYKLIIVDQSSPNIEFKQFLENSGYEYYVRENTGHSYGGYKWAWDKFKDTYDYYLFHEQDWIPAKDNWLRDLLIKFHSDKDIGMVGNSLEDRTYPLDEDPESWNGPDRTAGTHMSVVCPHRKWMCNLDGEYHFTSSRVLKQVDSIGGLQIYETEQPTINELAFQQRILELGYSINSYSDGRHLLTIGYRRRHREPAFEHLTVKDIAPMINGYMKDASNDKEIKQYFSWYKGNKLGQYVKEWEM